MIGHLNVSNSLRDINEQERNKYRERERWGSAPPPGMMTCHLFASEGRRHGNESRRRLQFLRLLLLLLLLLLDLLSSVVLFQYLMGDFFVFDIVSSFLLLLLLCLSGFIIFRGKFASPGFFPNERSCEGGERGGGGGGGGGGEGGGGRGGRGLKGGKGGVHVTMVKLTRWSERWRLNSDNQKREETTGQRTEEIDEKGKQTNGRINESTNRWHQKQQNDKSTRRGDFLLIFLVILSC